MQQLEIEPKLHDGECATRDWPMPAPFNWEPKVFDLDRLCEEARERLAAKLDFAVGQQHVGFCMEFGLSFRRMPQKYIHILWPHKDGAYADQT